MVNNLPGAPLAVQSSTTASMAYRGEIFAFNATANMAEHDNVPPKTNAQGMQHPGRREALLREFDGHCKRRTWKIVDHPGPGVPVMQSFEWQCGFVQGKARD